MSQRAFDEKKATEIKKISRRQFTSSAIALGTTAAVASVIGGGIETREAHASNMNPLYADPKEPGLPPSTMELKPGRAALVVVDPQVDFLHEKGVAWGVIGQSVKEHNVVKHLEDLMKASQRAEIPMVVSPHYYYPFDHKWRFEGALEKVMHNIGMFDRPGPLDMSNFEGSGADFMEQYKPYIYDGKTVICSPHKVYGPEQNDLALQLRKLHIDQVVLCGMSSNLCVESHMRELLEMGFEVAVVKDATAGAKVPEGDGYLASLINFRMIANAVWTTKEAVSRIHKI